MDVQTYKAMYERATQSSTDSVESGQVFDSILKELRAASDCSTSEQVKKHIASAIDRVQVMAKNYIAPANLQMPAAVTMNPTEGGDVVQTVPVSQADISGAQPSTGNYGENQVSGAIGPTTPPPLSTVTPPVPPANGPQLPGISKSTTPPIRISR